VVVHVGRVSAALATVGPRKLWLWARQADAEAVRVVVDGVLLTRQHLQAKVFNIQGTSLCALGLALAYMYACAACVHVRTLGQIVEKWSDIIDQRDMAICSMYGMSTAYGAMPKLHIYAQAQACTSPKSTS
jgi:hypothetical protein